jgi:mono/diheme cytochrome c family protein
MCAAVVAGVALGGCGSDHRQVSTTKRVTRAIIFGENLNGRGPILLYPTGGPVSIDLSPPGLKHASLSRRRLFAAGSNVAAESGCLACHKIGASGNRGPGPDLTHVGDRLSAARIARALVSTTPPMPSFKNLPPAKMRAVVAFLSELRR